MRKKAERKIRLAAEAVGPMAEYPIGRIRGETDLIRKVFDKTLLDMARVGTVALRADNGAAMDPHERDDAIRQREIFYVAFRFLTAEPAPEPLEPERMDVVLKGIDREVWLRFAHRCSADDHPTPVDTIEEMIRDYLNHGSRHDPT